MLEVINYLAQLENKTLEDIIAIAQEKATKRGGFSKKIYLERVLKKEH